MREIPGDSEFTRNLNKIIKSSRIGQNFFYLWGPEFTGKSFFSQTYCLYNHVIPISISEISWQDAEKVKEFDSQLQKIQSQNLQSVIIFDQPPLTSQLEKIFTTLIKSQTCDIFVISREKVKEIISWLLTTSWAYHEIYFPPLKKRIQDVIPALVYVYKNLTEKSLKVSPDAARILELFNWPRNFFDVITLAKKISKDQLEVEDLPDEFFDTELTSEFDNGIILNHDIAFVWRMKIKYRKGINFDSFDFSSYRKLKFVSDLLDRVKLN